MKYFVLLCIFFCLGAFANSDAIPGDGTQPGADSGSYGQEQETENDMFGKLRNIEPVKSKYDSCVSERKSAADKDKQSGNNTEIDKFNKKYNGAGLAIGDCIWSQLEVPEKERVQEMVKYMEKDENGQNRQPAANEEDNSKQYEGVSLISSKSIKLDPVDQKVQDFFAKKLVDGLYGTDKKKAQMVKHDNFYTLYKSRVSKNVLETISAFCMEALPVEATAIEAGENLTQPQTKKTTSFIIPHSKDPKHDVILRKAARAWNMANMSQTTKEGKNVANSVWEICMGKINNVCTESAVICLVKKNDKGECPPGSSFNGKLDETFYNSAANKVLFSEYQKGDNQEYPIMQVLKDHVEQSSRPALNTIDLKLSYQATTGSACKVSQYLKGSRQTLKALEKLSNKLDNRRTNGGDVIGLDLKTCDGEVGKSGCEAKNNIKEYDSGDKETGIDSLTTMTSKEAVEGSGMKDAQKELADEFKKCQESGDTETCKKFLATNRKEQEAMLAEYEIRSNAMVGKLEKLEKSTGKDEITKYLKEEGYSDEQISSMLENPDKVKKLKTEIKEKYAASRKNLIEEMRRKLDGGTTTKDGEVDVKEDKAAIDTIAAELTDKTSRYKDLVHFNNIVSGYLAIGEGDDAKRNTASLFRELEDVDGSDQAAQAAKEGITQAASEAGISDDREDENKDPASLGVDEINEHILDHEIVE